MAKKGWIFGHFCPSLPAYKLPLDPIFALIDKNIINGCCHNKSTDRELLQTVTSQSSCHFLENLIFGYFWLFTAIFACLYKIPWPPSLLLLTNLISFGAFEMIPTKEKATPGYNHPIFALFSVKSILAICCHFSLFLPAFKWPLDPPLLLLTKMLTLGAVEIFSMEKKLLQAITIPLSCHLLKNLIFSHFSPFTPICACFWATPWPRL